MDKKKTNKQTNLTEEKGYIKARNYSYHFLLDEDAEKQKYLYSYLDLD